MSIAERLLKGSAWLGLARVLVNALAVLSTVVLARLLAPEDFGLVALATTMMLVMTEVTQLSLATALVRHRAPERAHFDTAWTLNAMRGLVLGALFALAGLPMARFYDDPRLVPIMAALGASVLLGDLGNPRRIMLERDLIFWQEFVLNVVQKLAGVVASVAVAYLYRSYWALVVGIVVTQLANVVVSYLVLPFRPRITLAHSRELLSFSLWISIVQIVNTLNWRFDVFFVGKMLGSATLGHFSMATNLAAMPTREVTVTLKQPFFAAFSSLQADPPRLLSAYQRAQALVSALALPAGVGAALIAEPLVRLALGPKWEPIIVMLQVFAVVYAAQALVALVDPLSMAKGATRALFQRSVWMLAMRVPIVVLSLWAWGLMGLIAGRIVTGLLSIWINMAFIRRLTGLSLARQLWISMRSLVAVCMMVLAVQGLNHVLPPDATPHGLLWQVLRSMVVAAAVYGGSAWLLWRLMGCPDGPERELQRLGHKLYGKLRAR